MSPKLLQQPLHAGPPLLIMECPEGHLWVRVNPRWTTGNRRGNLHMWCPDHIAERKAHTATLISAMRIRASRELDELPLPSSRFCTSKNPHPDDHEYHAVLPISEFYLRPGKSRQDGSQAVYVVPVCKRCTRRRTAERRAKTDPEDLRRYQRNYKQNLKKRKEQATSSTIYVNPSLYLEWAFWVKPELTESEARALRRCESGETAGFAVQYIDAIMTRHGAADQFNAFDAAGWPDTRKGGDAQ